MPFLFDQTHLQRLRRFLLANSWVEPALFMVLLLVSIWIIAPIGPKCNKWLTMVILMLVPTLSTVWHGDKSKDLGLRFDNFNQAGRVVLITTLIATFIIIVIGLWLGWTLRLDNHVLMGFIGYLPWAFVQQFVVQAFIYRRLKHFLVNPKHAALMAAACFGLAHWPNPFLVILTCGASYFWSRYYERSPNIFVLAISQAWLSTILMAQIPKVITHAMVVGPRFWQ